jgi:serine phosphatase RsbU (regulator of sigma subunit)
VPPEERSISVDLPILTGLIQRGEPWEVPQAGDERVSAEFTFAPLRPDCLVPMLGRGGRLVGLLVLGSRLSDEPYSGEDKRLLASVARQAGTALENMRLAHEIAERIETERRTAREMEIAKEVQTRLLPQEPPHLRSLEFGAQCIQARSVGGDYYDFFDLGAGRVGFVLADVSGKGVHAALLMANLQAHLRSQCTMAPIDLVRVLQHVNRMLWKSTASQHYATLFLGVYEDDTRRLSYVNCGHIPPLCMRRDGSVERLAPTATVIGMFEDWEGSVARIQLAQGDVLAVFSDGITEAARDEEEFGEARVIDELRSHHELAAHELVASLLAGVQRFNTGAQSDDLTLLVAAVRA